MTGILVSKGFIATHGARLDEVATRLELKPDIVHLPDDPKARLSERDLDRIEVTMSTRDVRFSDHWLGRRLWWSRTMSPQGRHQSQTQSILSCHLPAFLVELERSR